MANAVIWIFNQAVEEMFAVSFGSLACNAPDVWDGWLKIIIDAGISDLMRAWLRSFAGEGVHVLPVSLPQPSEVVGGQRHLPAQIMLARLRLPVLVDRMIRAGFLPPVERFLHVDADTAFFASPQELTEASWGAEQIWAVKEWDWVGEKEQMVTEDLRMARDHCFISTAQDRHRRLAAVLGMSTEDLLMVPSYNSGVWVAMPGDHLTNPWEETYRKLRAADETLGGSFINPHSSEESALSLAIHRGAIRIKPLPRQYNYLPPREPRDWPSDTVIAHFVTFHLNHHWPAYRRWYAQRDSLQRNGLWPWDVT